MPQNLQELDQEFARLLEVIDENFNSDNKNNSQVIFHFFRYYKRVNNMFESAEEGEKEALFQHFKVQHDRLGETAKHISTTFDTPIGKFPSFVEGFHTKGPVERALRQSLQQEISRLGTNLRRYKRKSKAAPKPPSPGKGKKKSSKSWVRNKSTWMPS